MPCPRCQHENRPQAKFCEECASPISKASSTPRSDADAKGEVESLERQIVGLRTENAQLHLEVTKLRDDPDALEEVARERLGFVKPGEKVLKLPPGGK